jgi:hypothetical protein
VVGDQHHLLLMARTLFYDDATKICKFLETQKSYANCMALDWYQYCRAKGHLNAFNDTAAFFYVLTSKVYMPFWIVVHH